MAFHARPRTWFLAGLVLAVLGVVGAAAPWVLVGDSIKAMPYDWTTDDGRVTPILGEGRQYYVYIADGATAGADPACTMGGERVALNTRPNIGARRTTNTAYGNPDVRYRYVGMFTAPTSGETTVTCAGLGDTWLLKEDDGGGFWAVAGALGAVASAVLAGVLWLVAIALAVFARARRRRTA